MCGIGLLLRGRRFVTSEALLGTDASNVSADLPEQKPVDIDRLCASLAARGPTLTTQRDITSTAVSGFAIGSVLHMRGPEPVPQPFSTPGAKSFLLWNGEVYGGSGVPVPPDGSDTAAVFDAFRARELKSLCHMEFTTAVRDLLEDTVCGCFAFIYWSEKFNSVIFGRDPMGRRSLLFHHAMWVDGSDDDGVKEPALIIASVGAPEVGSTAAEAINRAQAKKRKRGDEAADVSTKEDDTGVSELPPAWCELPITGCFCLQMASTEPVGLLLSFPWKRPHTVHPLRAPRVSPYDIADRRQTPYQELRNSVERRIMAVVDKIGYACRPDVDAPRDVALRYLFALATSVALRLECSHWHHVEVNDTTNGPSSEPVMVPFSGGIDCTVIAALSLLLVPDGTPIELVNFSGSADPLDAPDRVASERSVSELMKLLEIIRPNSDSSARPAWDQIRYIQMDATTEDMAAAQETVFSLIFPLVTVMDHDIGSAIWFTSRGLGGQKVDLASLRASGRATVPNKHYRLEGAYCDAWPAEDSSTTNAADGEDPYRPLVETLTLEGVSETDGKPAAVLLSTLGKEYGAALTPHWTRLGYRKLGPYLDAAEVAGVIRFGGPATGKYISLRRPEDIERAAGRSRAARAPVETEPYSCQSHLILLGMGADESLGGYARHLTSQNRGGDEQLLSELQRDFSRLWQRNLGRDDRIAASSGREARFPFLDEEVLAAIAATKVTDVCNPMLGIGIGDKRLLRTAARLLGLNGVTKLQKRAIQFGTRVADRKLRGSAQITTSGN